MQNRFQDGSLFITKNKPAPHTWFFRYREDRGGKRVNRKIRLGSTKELPHRRDAEKAALHLRVKANSEVRVPETVSTP